MTWPDTVYRKITRRRYDIEWSVDEPAVAYDRKSDGMYPLLVGDNYLGRSTTTILAG